MGVLNFIKRIFVWWDGQTLGTQLWTWRNGKKVGEDAMGNIYKGMAKAIRNEQPKDGEYPTVMEGVRGMQFIEKVVESNRDGNVWINL